MNKIELARALLEKNPKDIETLAAAERIVDSSLDIICETLAKGEPVNIWGFGCLEVRKRSARPVRNPRTKEVTQLEAHRVVCLKAGKALKDCVS